MPEKDLNNLVDWIRRIPEKDFENVSVGLKWLDLP